MKHDRTNWNEKWPGTSRETYGLYMDYNIGDKLNVTVKFYNNLPPYKDYCSAYLWLRVNHEIH